MASLKLPKEVDEKKLAEKVAAQVLGSIKQPATIDQAKLVQDVTQKVKIGKSLEKIRIIYLCFWIYYVN